MGALDDLLAASGSGPSPSQATPALMTTDKPYQDAQGKLHLGFGSIPIGTAPAPTSGANPTPPPQQPTSALDALLARSGAPPSRFDMANAPTLPADPALDSRAAATANQMRIQANDPGVGATLVSQAAQGLTGNFSDEIMAGLKSGFGLVGDYNEALQHERDILQSGAEAHPVLSTAANVAGSLGSLAIPGLGEVGAVARGAGLGAKMLAGAKVGAAYGALSGAGGADGGLGDRIQGAATGAGLGAVTGGALPAALAVGRGAVQPIASAIAARNPSAYAASKIASRVGNMDRVQSKISRAAASGQNMAIAEVGGDNARTLLRTAANVPGPGKAAINARVNIGAMGQGDRIKRFVNDSLASPEGAYQAAKATVMDARSRAAAPHYDRAYRQPVPFTFSLERLLNTPAGRSALAAARTNSENRREPWAQWFLNVSPDGRIIDARRVPDMRALDEVKRVLDRMVEGAKAPADGSPFAKAKATPESIAIQTVRDDLVRSLDSAGETAPARRDGPYARARAVGLDNIQADEALEFGRNALNTDSRVIARRMGDPTAYGRDTVFNDGQRELARMGLAEAIRDKIDRGGFTHNALLKFFNSREAMERLKPFFRNAQQWIDFQSAMFNEARKAKVTNAVRGNSTTAAQLADMADAGNLDHVVDTTRQVLKGNIVGPALAAVVGAIQRRINGLTPAVAKEIGRQLLTRDPAQVAQIVTQIRGIEDQQLSRSETMNRIRKVLTALVASQEGTRLAPQPNARRAAQ